MRVRKCFMQINTAHRINNLPKIKKNYANIKVLDWMPRFIYICLFVCLTDLWIYVFCLVFLCPSFGGCYGIFFYQIIDSMVSQNLVLYSILHIRRVASMCVCVCMIGAYGCFFYYFIVKIFVQSPNQKKIE